MLVSSETESKEANSEADSGDGDEQPHPFKARGLSNH